MSVVHHPLNFIVLLGEAPSKNHKSGTDLCSRYSKL